MARTEQHSISGEVLAGRYRVGELIGSGGMGAVYQAEHIGIGRTIAIKLLHPELCRDRELVDRFLREARAAPAIDHENVVSVLDIGTTDEGHVFFAMEYLKGENLRRTLTRDGPMPWERFKPIALQICDALAAVHRAGIIHRDLKPDNCHRIRFGRNPDFIKILDFGIARIVDMDVGSERLTGTGQVMGTNGYMAPEQACGDTIDHRVDIYSFGVLAFEMLTGRKPFHGKNYRETLKLQLVASPPEMKSIAADLKVPISVEQLIRRLLSADPEDRVSSMEELSDTLAAVDAAEFYEPTKILPVAPSEAPREPESPASNPEVPRTMLAVNREHPRLQSRSDQLFEEAKTRIRSPDEGAATDTQHEHETPVSTSTPDRASRARFLPLILIAVIMTGFSGWLLWRLIGTTWTSRPVHTSEPLSNEPPPALALNDEPEPEHEEALENGEQATNKRDEKTSVEDVAPAAPEHAPSDAEGGQKPAEAERSPDPEQASLPHAESKPPPSTKAEPDAVEIRPLSEREVLRKLKRQSERVRKACSAKGAVPGVDRVKLGIKIGDGGVVTAVSVKLQHAGSALGRCVAKEAKKTRFRKAESSLEEIDFEFAF